MTAGLILLSAYGKIDLYISYKPQITFFKIVYKRHTYFSMETIDQYFSSIPNLGSQVSGLLFNNADLISDMYLTITLPNLILYTTNSSSASNFVIRWVDNIGLRIIKTIELEMNGRVIQKLNNDWLVLWYNLFGFTKYYPKLGSNKRGIDHLIGNIPELTKFDSQKNAYVLTIPLPFWFAVSYGQALPMNSINFSEVKVNLELEALNKLIIYGPLQKITIKESISPFTPYEYISQGSSIGIYISFDSSTNTLYLNCLVGSFVTSTNSITTEILSGSNSLLITNSKGYFVQPTSNQVNTDLKYSNTVQLSTCNLQVNYIFLENEERKRFYQTKHTYIIEQIQYYVSSNIVSYNNSILLNFINPVIELVWYLQLQTNVNNNDYFNFTDNVINGNTIGKNVYIQLNGYDVFTNRSIDFTEKIQLYENHLNCKNIVGLNVYSFDLKPEVSQPSGSCNFSRIEKAFLNFTTEPLISYSNTAILKIFARSYNILVITNGVPELLF
jgi:hypothetical protein